MIRPHLFGSNPLTVNSNSFQARLPEELSEEVRQKAQSEWQTFVDMLTQVGVDVIPFEDTDEPPTPDAVFPNNWISFHGDLRMISYPLFAPNRRWE